MFSIFQLKRKCKPFACCEFNRRCCPPRASGLHSMSCSNFTSTSRVHRLVLLSLLPEKCCITRLKFLGQMTIDNKMCVCMYVSDLHSIICFVFFFFVSSWFFFLFSLLALLPYLFINFSLLLFKMFFFNY